MFSLAVVGRRRRRGRLSASESLSQLSPLTQLSPTMVMPALRTSAVRQLATRSFHTGAAPRSLFHQPLAIAPDRGSSLVCSPSLPARSPATRGRSERCRQACVPPSPLPLSRSLDLTS